MAVKKITYMYKNMFTAFKDTNYMYETHDHFECLLLFENNIIPFIQNAV